MAAQNHKELICWQLCARLRSLVIKYIRKGPASKDFRFRDQMRAAARSACYQTSEGFYFFKHKIFAHYLDGAYASLGELLDQINDGREQEYFTEEQQVEMTRLARRAMKADRGLQQWLLSHPDPPPPSSPLPRSRGAASQKNTSRRSRPPRSGPEHLGTQAPST
jgi:four helix bundle protein